MLPNLPKKAKKREASFGLDFRGWLLQSKMPSGIYELKQTTKDYIAFDVVTTGQLSWLLRAGTQEGALFKPSDMAPGEKPCDYWYIKDGVGMIVIKYPQGFVIIPVRDFIAERERSDRRSLTWDRAKELDVKAP